jgi:hypothetical protein
MRLKQGQVWGCLNSACGARIQVTEPGRLAEGGNPRCGCGSLMKMDYSKPQLRLMNASEEVKRLLRDLSVVLK